MLIDRVMFTCIQAALEGEPKVIIIYGPRQAGKTTLIERLVQGKENESLFLTGDDLRTQELLSIPDLDKLKAVVGDKKLLVVDEAQRIENIGLSLKLLYDSLKIRIIASGSSSFDLANKIAEPLTGRATVFTLYPFSFVEPPLVPPAISKLDYLEGYLRFGLYPKAVTISGQTDRENYLYDLLNNYLYRDLLAFETIRKPKKMVDLLTLLALQISNEVNVAELASNLSLTKGVVEKYLDILEKMFLVVNLRGFSRNLRKEISKTSKYYFVDLGLRNGLIRNFNPLDVRDDSGALFENFCIIERMKIFANSHRFANFYFWRTYDQKEIDFIEESGGKLRAFEFKFSNEKKSTTPSREFMANYPGSSFLGISRENLENFLA